MLRIQRMEGEAVTVGEYTVTPVSRRIAIGAGGGTWGLWAVHDGPAHVRVEGPRGIARASIRDVTLWARVASLALVLGALFLRRRRA